MPPKTTTKKFESEIEFENVFMFFVVYFSWSNSYPIGASPNHALIPLHTHSPFRRLKILKAFYFKYIISKLGYFKI